MLTKKIKSKKVICSLFICFAMLISAFCGINNNNISVQAIADNYRVNVSSDLLNSYYNFNTSSNAKPANATGWTVIDTYVTDDTEIVDGIVDVKSDTTFPTETYHTTKPTMPKENSGDTAYFKNLMINSYAGINKLGYKSSSISLAENSFYSIEVRLYTHRTENTDPSASIYLSGLVEENEENEEYGELIKFENINTLTSWPTYKFYIATDSEVSINLELWLGSKSMGTKGAVFFNNVSIYRYSEDYFEESIVSNTSITNSTTSKIIDLSSDTEYEPVDNSSFERTTPLGWSKQDGYSSTQKYQIVNANTFKLEDDNYTISAPGSNCSPNNDYVLFMYNPTKSYQGIESESFTIEQLSYYKITFWAKSNSGADTSATVKLVDKTKENPIESASISLTNTYTVGTNKFRNDWTQYTFYVYGSALEDKNVALQIWLGSQESTTKGYIFVDDFRADVIDYTTYSNSSSSSNSATLNFNNDTDEFVISNNNFNKTQNEDDSTTFPLKPTGWTTSGNFATSSVYSGVINTDATHFEDNLDNYYDSVNTNRKPVRPGNLPYTTKENNNVLMIGSSSTENSQSYNSNELSLGASSYYKLTFYVFTDYNVSTQKDVGARVQLNSGNRVLFDYFNIFYDDNNWHQFEIYIKTGMSAETATLSLMLEKVAGYVFFDEVMLLTSSEGAYNNYYKDINKVQLSVDLSVENFDNRTYNKLEKIQSANNWTASEVNDSEATVTGILEVNNENINGVSGTMSGNKKALYISSLHDVYYTYTSKQSQSYTAQTYYKISVNIYTQNIMQEYNKNNDITPGASFGLKSSKDIQFKGIDTKGDWKTYALYFCLNEDLSSTITLGLGYTNELTCGDVLFDNLQITTLADKDAYLEEIKELDESQYISYINYVEPTEENEEESEWENNFEDWWVIPSLLTGLAIIISVIGFYIRRINFKRKPKIKTKYDRRKTLDKDIDRREKIALRQQIISELNAELEMIDKEMAEFTKTAQAELENLKNKILAEQEELKHKKLEIEIQKKEATAEREKQLKDNPNMISNAKAEKDYSNFIAKLDKAELNIQKQITLKDIKLASTDQIDKSRLAKFLERKEYIKNEIIKIEEEIAEIAKEEKSIWEEYKQAKTLAKQRKTQFKENAKNTKKVTSKENFIKVDKKKSDSPTTKTETKKTTSKTTPKKSSKEVNTKNKK